MEASIKVFASGRVGADRGLAVFGLDRLGESYDREEDPGTVLPLGTGQTAGVSFVPGTQV
jgi:hypothetical protein